MQDDDQIKAALSIKKDMVINTGWKIECESEEVKEFMTNVLLDVNADLTMDASFEDSLRDMLSSYGYGFSLTEPVHFLKDGKWVWRCFKTRPPHTFKLEIDEKGNVTEIVQTQRRGDVSFKPGLFLHHVYQQQFGNPYGKSDLSAAHPPWKMKKFVTRFFGIYLERYAQPTVAAQHNATADENEITRVFELLKKMQSNTVLTFPDTFKVDLIYPARDGSDAYIKAIDLLNMQIARSILVPDLMGVSGTATKGGSFALGKEQFKVFLGTIYKDRQSLERKVTLKLVRPLVKMNFGDIPCEFKFIEYTEDDVSTYADIWLKAVTGKVFEANDEEINHLRNITGFPEGPITRPTPEVQFDQEGNPIPPPDGPKGAPEGDPKAKGKPKPDAKEPPKKKEFALKTFRERTAFEKKIDFGSVKDVLDTSEDAVTPELERAAKKIATDYVQQIKERGVVSGFRPDKLNDIKPKHLKDMNLVFRNHFRGLFRNAIAAARAELFPNGSRVTRFTDALLPEEFEETLEAESFKIVGEFSDTLRKKANTAVLEGIKAGRSEAEIVNAVRELLGDAADAWIGAIVRTKTTETYNNARRSYWENDELASQIVVAYQFSAIMDNRTSEVCAALDQKIFEIGGDVDRVTPPLHFNCRSLLVPVTKFEDYKADKIPSVDKIQDLGGGLKNFKSKGS